MDPRTIAAILFAIVLLWVLVKALDRPFHVFGRVVFQAITGLIFLKAWDMAAASLGWPVIGLNLATGAIMGLLGLPGFLSLLVIRYGLS